MILDISLDGSDNLILFFLIIFSVESTVKLIVSNTGMNDKTDF